MEENKNIMTQNMVIKDNQHKTGSGNSEETRGILEVQNLSAWYGKTMAIKNINMSIRSNAIMAIIGPSGCGKSTFIRCLNRMHEVSHGGRTEGCIMLDGKDIYARDADPVVIRRRIGMVFQNRRRSRRCRSSITWLPV